MKLVDAFPGSDPLQAPQIQEYLTALESAREFAALIAKPSGLTIRVGGSADYDPQALSFGFDTERMNRAGTAMLDLKHGEAVMIHEYGHAVQDSAMRTSTAAWRTYLIDSPAATNADLVQSRIRNTVKNLPKDGGEIDWDRVAQTHPDLKRAYELLDRENKLTSIAHAYTEFFADVVASVYFDDPRVISDAIDDPGRDFSHEFSHAELEQWKNDVADGGKKLPYLLLEPSRFTLWKSYLETGRNDRSAFLKTAFELIAQGFSEALAGTPDPARIDPETLNRRLSELFQATGSPR
jgi:hypothetical protein